MTPNAMFLHCRECNFLSSCLRQKVSFSVSFDLYVATLTWILYQTHSSVLCRDETVYDKQIRKQGARKCRDQAGATSNLMSTLPPFMSTYKSLMTGIVVGLLILLWHPVSRWSICKISSLSKFLLWPFPLIGLDKVDNCWRSPPGHGQASCHLTLIIDSEDRDGESLHCTRGQRPVCMKYVFWIITFYQYIYYIILGSGGLPTLTRKRAQQIYLRQT